MYSNVTARKFLTSAKERNSFRSLQALRSVFAIGIILFISRTVDIGTDLSLLVLAALVGIFFAGNCVARSRRISRVAVWHLAIISASAVILWIIDRAISGDPANPSRDFAVYRFSSHATLLLLAYGVGFVSTYLFWLLPQIVTLESIGFSVLFVWLLGGHRNYHLDAPKNISALAWDYGLSPQHLILGAGVVAALTLGAYLVLAHSRPIFRRRAPVSEYGKTRRLLTALVPTALLALLVAFAAYIDSEYSQNLTRATNGVGENSKEGQSPLGFHSAVGKTKQPAALVRLEGDYADNPWAPMLYLREGALSAFNGKELVLADRAYDTDVPRVAPGQSFTLDQTQKFLQSTEGSTRETVVQSIYLLAKHTSPFGIDFPTSIRQIKNPDPQRFELTYQVSSLAPMVKLDALIGEEVGDPSWDKATWEHYLRAPGSNSKREIPADAASSDTPVLDESNEDLRYKAMAEKIAGGNDPIVQRAEQLSAYLSKESIYTRSPGHQLTERGDPVAPYLFAKEKRGYCVHFAHAAVYMMRLLGIPARIATGYLTDLAYAKDGHILLHLGDRHAWPEIYVRGLGWVVVDVTPAQAENEQVIVPDENLLQELMSKIDPAEELLQPPPLDPESEKESQTILGKVLKQRVIVPALLTLLVALLLLKLWLRFGYALFPPGRRKARLAYISFASTMADLGLPRAFGETRREYAERLGKVYGVQATDITALNEQNCFAQDAPTRTQAELGSALSQVFGSLRSSRVRLRRWLAPLSPLSLFRAGRW